MIVSFHILVLLSSFHLLGGIFYRQVLVQNVHTHIVATTASSCFEARNKQANKKNGCLNPLTQICLWGIACFCNVAQIEKEKKRKTQANPNSQYFLTSGIVFYLGSVLPFHFSPGHLTKQPSLWISLLWPILVSWAEETLLADLSCVFSVIPTSMKIYKTSIRIKVITYLLFQSVFLFSFWVCVLLVWFFFFF